MRKEEKAQSAMQYLTTYAWAFLIIALVLVALFGLGVFTGPNAARAEPGSCHVLRPYGPFSNQFMSLTGLCNGEYPEFVSQFSGTGYSTLTTVSIPYANTVTNTAWIYVTAWTNNAQNIVITGYGGSPSAGAGTWMGVNKVVTHEVDFAVWTYPGPGIYYRASSSPNTIVLNRWYFVAGEYNGTSVSIWLNGTLIANTPASNNIYPPAVGLSKTVVGGDSALGGGFFRGYIANLQVYNSSLSRAELHALYIEGVGGAPIDLESLLAWWPLNGNSNDYSGDNYNATHNNGILYTSQWPTNYAQP